MRPFLGQAYNAGASSRMGGGLLGMLLSWPLWKALGIVGGVIVSILALIGCAHTALPFGYEGADCQAAPSKPAA